MNGLFDSAIVSCLVLAVGLPGCRASASASVNTGAKTKEFSDEPIEPVEKGQAESDFGEGNERAMLGARHDLRLAKATTATCSCLAVALGAPNDPAFSWVGQPPNTDPESQIVVALTSEGLTCQNEPADSLGASYWGYKREGDDVIVIVEAAKFGRPITNGAVIPKPFGGGQVYVRPAGKNVPYGRPLSTADKDCRIGNPGPQRTGTPPPSETDQTLD